MPSYPLMPRIRETFSIPVRTKPGGLPELRRSAVFLLVLGLTGGCEDARMVADCSQWNTKEFFQQASASDVRTCLEADADPNAFSAEGTTPLHAAVDLNENLDIITVLARVGADPNARDQEQRTAWDYAKYDCILRGTGGRQAVVDARLQGLQEPLIRSELSLKPIPPMSKNIHAP